LLKAKYLNAPVAHPPSGDFATDYQKINAPVAQMDRAPAFQ
jgi:hypothetical protein